MAGTGVERQVVLLESHIRIARLCRPFLVPISLLILKLYINSTNLGAVVSLPW